MNTKALRQKVLDLAIHGKLVPQNPNDESATVLLEKIRAEKAEKIKKGELKADKKDSFIFVGSDKRHYEQFADGTVKDIEDEIPFDVPEGWAWCRLGEISIVKSSKRVFEKDYVTTGIPFYRSLEIGQLYRNEKLSQTLYITKEHYEELKRNYGVPSSGDILITSVGSIGNTWICDDREFYYKDGNVTQISKSALFDSSYMNYFLHSDLMDKQITDTVGGSAYNALTIEKLKNLIIPLPPPNEQQQIVKTIAKIFSQIESIDNNKSELDITIKQAKSKILDLAIHGKLVPQDSNDEPAEELLKRIATSDNRPYKKLSGDEIPFELPKTWIWQKLPDLCSIPITDGTHKTPTYSDKENGIPFLSSKDVTSGEIDWSKIKYITKELHEELYKRLAPQKNDILLAKNGTTGIAALVKDNTVFDIYVTLALIRPISKIIYPQYLLYIINSQFCKNQFNDHLTGIGVPNLHLVDINKTVIPLPPLSEQQRIVLKIEELFEYTDIINISIKEF